MKIRGFLSLWAILLAFSLTTLVPAEATATNNSKTSTASKKATPQKSASKKSAKKHSKRKTSNRKYSKAKPLPPYARQYSALVVDADTGRVLYSRDASGIRYPASLTKMMTLYLTFDALKKRRFSMDDRLPVSQKAASQPQTNISLKTGEHLPVRTAIESLVVRSANDSAMVLAEAIGGTEWNFALMMTKKARELGMKGTVFRNPSGLPDDKQYTTAYDMARLAIALRRDFPEYYPFFKLSSFAHNGITYPGHNHVMEQYDGVDGIKTGYIRASGYNLVTSAKKDGANIVAVVIGGKTVRARDEQMMALLDEAFDRISSQRRIAKKSLNESYNRGLASSAGIAQDIAQAR